MPCPSPASMRDGHPDVRMVLLKHADADGFVFYTNLESAKGRELLGQPHAALCFHWKSLRRQVRVRGPVSRVSDAEADAYFATRAKDSQIGAWASSQSRPMEGRFVFEREIAKYAAKYALVEGAAPAALVGLPRDARSRSSSGATGPSACMTGSSIAAPRQRRRGAPKGCSREPCPQRAAERHRRRAWQPDAEDGLGRGRRRQLSDPDQARRLSDDRFDRDAGLAGRFGARCLRLLDQPSGHPPRADAGRSASTASATARPSPWPG